VALVQVRVGSLGKDRNKDIPVVLLTEMEGERILPIWIGPAEASAIAIKLGEMEFARPLTHDLLASAIRECGGKVERAVVTRVAEHTYFAELHVDAPNGRVVLDSRPSDAIAVALRSEAGIFVEEDVFEAAAAVMPKRGDPEIPEVPDDPAEPPK
jgi:bifunctional DNase/RNase